MSGRRVPRRHPPRWERPARRLVALARRCDHPQPQKPTNAAPPCNCVQARTQYGIRSVRGSDGRVFVQWWGSRATAEAMMENRRESMPGLDPGVLVWRTVITLPTGEVTW